MVFDGFLVFDGFFVTKRDQKKQKKTLHYDSQQSSSSRPSATPSSGLRPEEAFGWSG